MALNKIGDDNLYIGGIMALSNKAALKRANITHIVSVLRLTPEEEKFSSFEHLQIPVDDVADEDILAHFPSTNAFIKSGLESGGGVLVHCAMGKSRSASICIAYFLHRQPGAITPSEALDLIRRSRPLCEPNDGFMEQLELYYKMGCPTNVTEHSQYKRWQFERVVEESVACGRAPEAEFIRFEDEQVEPNNELTDQSTEIKCRKCRRKLATMPFIIPHAQPQRPKHPRDYTQDTPCAHVFLHPLTWMRPSLFPQSDTDTPPTGSGDYDPTTEAPLSGRLTCPNPACGSNIGKFAWQGMRCNCGNWVVPAIGLARARVDIVDAGVKKGALAGTAGIRLPPGARVPPPATADSGGGKGLL
ncbi:tyrosine protein phosphatase yvh1 [Onygenales sp. PD_40]|nr:tyrosine protein phosphatase yvh1 [Onygenales sp. PD_40]